MNLISSGLSETAFTNLTGLIWEMTTLTEAAAETGMWKKKYDVLSSLASNLGEASTKLCAVTGGLVTSNLFGITMIAIGVIGKEYLFYKDVSEEDKKPLFTLRLSALNSLASKDACSVNDWAPKVITAKRVGLTALTILGLVVIACSTFSMRGALSATKGACHVLERIAR